MCFASNITLQLQLYIAVTVREMYIHSNGMRWQLMRALLSVFTHCMHSILHPVWLLLLNGSQSHTHVHEILLSKNACKFDSEFIWHAADRCMYSFNSKRKAIFRPFFAIKSIVYGVCVCIDSDSNKLSTYTVYSYITFFFHLFRMKVSVETVLWLGFMTSHILRHTFNCNSDHLLNCSLHIKRYSSTHFLWCRWRCQRAFNVMRWVSNVLPMASIDQHSTLLAMPIWDQCVALDTLTPSAASTGIYAIASFDVCSFCSIYNWFQHITRFYTFLLRPSEYQCRIFRAIVVSQ